MKKSFFTLILTMLVAFLSPNVASAFIINYGGNEGSNSSYYAPFCNYYRYSYAQTIYPGDQIISVDCDITSIAWEICGSSTVSCSTLKIYLGYADDQRFGSATWVPASQLTCVYNHAVTVGGSSNTWQTFEFDTPFHYQGGRHLVVAVAKETSSYSSALTFYEYNANNTSLYRQSDSYTYYADYTDNTAGTLRSYRPKINLNVEMGEGSNLVLSPDPMDLGDRANGAWNRPFMANLTNLAAPTTVTLIDTENPFFMVQDMSYPFQIGLNEEQEFLIGTGEGNGEQTGRLVVTFDDSRTFITADMTAFAYDPVCPDVWELARNVSSFPYSETITPATQGIYDNYDLPGDKEDGPDAVFKLTFSEDVLLNADVEGANGKIALYNTDFGGFGGPGEENFYAGTYGDNTREYIYAIGNANDVGNTLARFDPSDPNGTIEYLGTITAPGTLYGGVKIGDEFYVTGQSGVNALLKYNMNNLNSYNTIVSGVTSIVMAQDPVTGNVYLVQSKYLKDVNLQTGAIGSNVNVYVGNSFGAGLAFNDEGRLFGIHTSSHTSIFSEIDVQTGAVTDLYNLPDFGTTGSMRGLVWSKKNHVFYGSSAGTSLDSRQVFVIDPNEGLTTTTYVPDRWYEFLSLDLVDMSANRDEFVNPGGDYPISGLTLNAGTYYLAASSTASSFTVNINPETLPCAEQASVIAPADDEDGLQPAAVNLEWELGNYTTEYRLSFGSTYYCEDVLVDWTSDLATNYAVTNLYNNTNYFWRVDTRNSECETLGEVWGFTTSLNIPQNLRVADATIFEGQGAVLSWTAIQDRTYRYYNIYQDGELIASTPANVVTTTYTVNGLTYNMGGYNFYVTAVYDEGESAPSNTVNVKVSGNGNVAGHVYEQDGETGIAGATVTFTGHDEFGDSQTFNFITDATGAYGGAIMAGEYDGKAACNGYQTINAPVQGNPVGIGFNTTTRPIDFMLDEEFKPVCDVIAQYYPDSLDPASPYVKVYWGCGLPGGSMIEDFETGDFSQFDYNFPSSYPWEIVTTHPYEGQYCMKSGGTNIASASSSVEVTVDIPRDGLFSFYSYISCESSWDNGYYYMDGTQMGTVTGLGNSWVKKEFAVTAGTHTFKWTYTKDSSVNSGEDAWFVDYIDFVHPSDPPIPGETYTFDDGTTQGWTTIDADGDGRNWMVASSLLSGVAGHNGSADFVLSQSYDNSYGVLYPDNYFVSPQVELGGIVKFYACGQDANYAAEHFGVAVSTTGNTNAADFTTIQEWTLTAKKGGMPKRLRNDGTRDTRDQGNWYEFTADLSAYSGMGYVAIRHFNCSDEFYLDVDDITIGEPAKSAGSGRAFSHYRVYRTNCYQESPYTEENTVVLACELMDTLYIDVDWPDVAPGTYKWGVGVVYAGNRESEITWSEPTVVPAQGQVAEATREIIQIGEGLDNDPYVLYPTNTVWRYTLNEQIILASEIGTGGTINSIAYYSSYNSGGFASTVRNMDIYMKHTTKSSFSGLTDWDPVAASDLVYSGNVEFIGASGWTTIELQTPFQYNGTDNLIIACDDNTGSYPGCIYFGRHNTGDNRGIVVISDSENYNALSMSSYTAREVDNLTADIRLDITAGGSGEPIQEERESPIVWSNCLDKDMYLDGDVTVNVLLNSADNPEGATVTFTNLNELEQELYPMDPIVIDETGFYAFESFRKGDYSIKVEKEGYYSIEVEESIWEARDLRYVMTEIIYGINNLYVSSTGWAMWEGQGPGPVPPGPGDEFSEDFEGGLGIFTSLDQDGDGYGWRANTELSGLTGGHNSTNFVLSQSYDNSYGALNPDNYLVSPQVNLTNGSTFSFWACAQDESWAAEHFGVYVSDNGTSDWTMVQEWTLTAKGARHDGERGLRQGSWHQYTVDLSAFAGQKYIAVRHFNTTDMFYIDLDDAELTIGAKSDERHLEYYKVMCTSIDGQPIFNADTEHPFCQLATDELVQGEHYICKVAAMYSTGMSEWTECEWAYIPCDNYAGTTEGVIEEEPAGGNHFSWTYPTGPGPVPPGPGDEWAYSFDSSLDGWTTINANNDDHTWYHSNEAGNHSVAAITSHSGAGHMMSESYCNATYAAITPDDYLVAPAQSAITSGSTFSFWACAQDASYAAEHFGVAISTTGNTNAADFTTINEWTLTAKDGVKANPAATRNGKGTREGNWYQYTVDLSAYAGQNVWIAIRHFNCNDQFILCMDDAQLAIGAKGGRAAWDLIGSMSAYEAAHYGVATDGVNIYTSNWGYASAQYNFCKYDMSGNFIEGFNISGCGTIRDLDYDGQFFYGGANSSVLYTIDLANRVLVNTTNTGCSAIRHCSYDPQRDGFWVGGWDDLMLIDRNGSVIQTAPAPSSCAGSGFYEDENGNGHVYLWCEPQSVYDYNIANNNISLISNLTNVPGWDGSSTAGGAFVGQYGDKIAFFCNIQQSPNVIGIYELRDAGSPLPPTPGDNAVLGAMIFRDGEWLAQVDYPTSEYIDTDEYGHHVYCVRLIYAGTNFLPEGNIYYSMSCEECIEIVGGEHCPAGADIRGEYVWHEGGEFGALISWGGTPVPPPGPGDEFTEGFENGSIPTGWTTIDADGDGHNWTPASVLMAGYLIPFHGGADCITSESYSSSAGALTPDNYLVSPRVSITNGSTFSFWACAQDPSYAGEHYGVAISTTGNTNAADFTTIAEWTMTAKDAAEAGAYMSKDNKGTREGTWYQKTVDLSDYAGQQIYIAIRHFNCTDMFYLNVDDAELSIGAKSDRAAELVKYNVYRSADNTNYELIGSVNAVEGQVRYEYFDEVPAGAYYYQVTAVYDNDCESDPALAEDNHANNYVIVAVTGVEENEGIALYPNPTSGNVKIEAVGMNHITVVSALGQVVYDAEVSCDEYELNMAQFNAGIYMVRISSESGVSTQRVTVVR